MAHRYPIQCTATEFPEDVCLEGMWRNKCSQIAVRVKIGSVQNNRSLPTLRGAKKWDFSQMVIARTAAKRPKVLELFGSIQVNTVVHCWWNGCSEIGLLVKIRADPCLYCSHRALLDSSSRESASCCRSRGSQLGHHRTVKNGQPQEVRFCSHTRFQLFSAISLRINTMPPASVLKRIAGDRHWL